MTYLTSAEVAELLKVSPKTISRWALEYAGYAPRALGPVRLIRDRVLAGLRRATPGVALRSSGLDGGALERRLPSRGRPWSLITLLENLSRGLSNRVG